MFSGSPKPARKFDKKQMDNGEDYLSVMKENLTALKTTDTGKRFSQKPLKTENRG